MAVSSNLIAAALKDPLVWLDMTQAQLNDAYNQAVYAPNLQSVLKRIENQNLAAHARLGEPEKYFYGVSLEQMYYENLLVYRSIKSNAPIHVFIHGGTWRYGSAEASIHMAEPLVNAGANLVLLNFSNIVEGVPLSVLARQVRDAVAWVHNNAEKIGGDPEQIFVSGHSSGGHLAGVVLTTDWEADYSLPTNLITGGLCSSGMFDLEPVRLSSRNDWLKLSPEDEQNLSAQRQIDKLNAPVIIAYGTQETPEFQRQSVDFAAAISAAGKPVQLLVAEEYNHFEILETYANPYGVIGQALLVQMGLADS